MRIRSFVAFAILFTVAALGLPRGHAAPEGSWSLDERIPSDAWGYVALEDVGSWEKRFEQTAIHKLFTQPDMQAFLAPVMDGFKKMTDGSGGGPLEDMPPAMHDLMGELANMKGDLALAVLGLERKRGTPAIVASLDFGTNAAKFGEALKAARGEIDPKGERIDEETKDGRTYWSVDADGMRIVATVFDSAFVISNDPMALEQVIAGNVEKSLATHDSYRHVRAKAGGDNLALFGFANMAPIMDMMQAQAPEEQMSMMTKMGVDTIHGIGFGVAFEGDGFRDGFIVHAPNADHGIMNLIRYRPFEPETVKWAPEGTFLFSESSASLDEYVANIRTLMETMEPGASEQMDRMMAQIKTHLGVDIEKELLPQLDGQVGMFAGMPPTGGLYPEVVLTIKAKDGDAFESTMKRLVEGAAGAITEEGGVVAVSRSVPFREHTLHLLDLEGSRRRDMIPFTPTWTRLQGNWFAITLVPHTMKELILRATTTAEPGLAQQEDFQAVLAAAPKDSGSIGYVDLQALMTFAYDTGVPLLQTALKPNMMPRGFPQLDFALLPPTRLIRPYFRSMGMYTSWNDEGLAISSYGPIPMGVVLVAVVAGATFYAMGRGSSMMRAPMVVREPKAPGLGEVQRSIAEMQARDLARQVRIYILEHAAVPANLRALVEKEQLASVPQDPWSQPYRLVVTNAETKTFQIVSAGADRKMGTADDVLIDG